MLLPCPFCGHEGYVDKCHHAGREYVNVGCHTNRCPASTLLQTREAY